MVTGYSKSLEIQHDCTELLNDFLEQTCFFGDQKRVLNDIVIIGYLAINKFKCFSDVLRRPDLRKIK